MIDRSPAYLRRRIRSHLCIAAISRIFTPPHSLAYLRRRYGSASLHLMPLMQNAR